MTVELPHWRMVALAGMQPVVMALPRDSGVLSWATLPHSSAQRSTASFMATSRVRSLLPVQRVLACLPTGQLSSHILQYLTPY